MFDQVSVLCVPAKLTRKTNHHCVEGSCGGSEPLVAMRHSGTVP